jgi:GAF domain-containing protein
MPYRTLDLVTLRILGTDLEDGRIGHEEYRQSLAALLLQRFRCSRVTLWRLVGEEEPRILRCIAARSSAEGPLANASELVEAQYGRYFAELTRAGVYVCVDTLADPNLVALRDRHGAPGGTRAMLDAAFTIDGATLGVICCEQTEPRTWKTRDVCDLKRFAAVAALQVARIEARDAWSASIAAG